MPRKPSGKPHTNLVRRRQKNGWYHVFEVTSVYDPKIRNSRAIATKLVGKLPPGETDIAKMVPTRERRKKQSVSETVMPNLKDTRDLSKVRYPLDLTVLVIVCALFAGHTSCYQIAEFWKISRESFQRYYKDFPEANISHDTIRRVIAMIGKGKAENVLRKLTAPLVGKLKGHIIALDGQAVKATRSAKGDLPRYVLNLYDTDGQIVLEQKLVGEKNNEITHAVEIIQELDLQGSIVTCDALNTQKKFADALIEKGADYCLALKENQESTYDEVRYLFCEPCMEYAKRSEKLDVGHGRIETRTMEVLPGYLLSKEIKKKWRDIEDGTILKAQTESLNKLTGEITIQDRYFLSSLGFDQEHIAEAAMRAVRGHWGIENTLHWVLDVTYNQDRTQCKQADYLKGRTVINKVLFNFVSKLQQFEEEETGKKASSKPVWKVRLMKVENCLKALAQIYGKRS